MTTPATPATTATTARKGAVSTRHRELHGIDNTGWLRAAVLGANDGIVSTASLVVGVVAANASPASVLLAGVSALVAGAMSMATGEYVSVSSQSDAESTAMAQEKSELELDYPAELRELTAIYVRRGLDRPLAACVAEKLMQRDALGAHARDELGLSQATAARPLQAALASALSFAAGSAVPLAVILLAPHRGLLGTVTAAALLSLAALGGLAAKTSGAPVLRGVVRVTFWSALALAVTAGVGTLFSVPA